MLCCVNHILSLSPHVPKMSCFRKPKFARPVPMPRIILFLCACVREGGGAGLRVARAARNILPRCCAYCLVAVVLPISSPHLVAALHPPLSFNEGIMKQIMIVLPQKRKSIVPGKNYCPARREQLPLLSRSPLPAVLHFLGVVQQQKCVPLCVRPIYSGSCLCAFRQI